MFIIEYITWRTSDIARTSSLRFFTEFGSKYYKNLFTALFLTIRIYCALIYSQKETPAGIRVAMLQLLCVWLAECPTAVHKMLDSSTNLVQYVSYSYLYDFIVLYFIQRFVLYKFTV